MNHLSGIRRSKARQIEAYFRTVRSQVRTLRENRIAIDGVRAFTSEFNELDGPKPSPELETDIANYYKTEYLPKLQKLVPARAAFENYMPTGRGAYALQQAFLVRNPFPTGSKELLEASGDVRGYSRVHAAYHRSFRKITEEFGY